MKLGLLRFTSLVMLKVIMALKAIVFSKHLLADHAQKSVFICYIIGFYGHISSAPGKLRYYRLLYHIQ